MDPITKALLAEFVKQNELEDLPEDKQFEHFAAFSVIASRYGEEFSTSDVVLGGGADLGIDGCGIILNGRLIDDEQEVEDIQKLNGYLEAEFIFVQAKRSANFDGSAMLSLGQNLKDAVFTHQTSPPISLELKKRIKIIDEIYNRAATFRKNPECRIYYVTTGIWNNDQYLQTIVKKQVSDLNGTSMFSEVKYQPVGAQGLQQLYRNTKYTISRQINFDRTVVLPSIDKVKAAYLGAIPASEFVKLIIDEDDNIVKSVFIDNVRDFQGENPVNTGISATLTSGLLDQFVLRNNGVTIVARDLSITGQMFTVRDYQIVNGCQTSHVLYMNRASLTDNLYVPLKLIYTDDEEIAQEVIKSTNRQTPVDENDLLALTKFQRDLEIYYSGMPDNRRLYYERRSKQYASRADVERTRIIPIGIQLKAFASMFLDAAHQAGRYQATLLKQVGESVFKAGHRPEAYYTAALTFYRFESLLRRGHGDTSDLRSFKFHFLPAFRHRFEESDFPGFEHKKISTWCEPLNTLLADADRSREAFEICADLIRRAANSRNLQIERDAVKVQTLTEGIRALAIKENDVKKPKV
ncbi:AIPR family protein [Niveispirillum sp. KHB5.9]|uniref:AIPR family protein n=1 Tax=Niveispirillum sp. KHB5.9 TaxID=3400269 RepID=UPI003A86D261